MITETTTTEVNKKLSGQFQGRTPDDFAKIQTKYKLKTPQEIQMHIIWIHLKQLCINSFGDDTENLRLINYYDEQWKQCEVASLKLSETI